MVGLARYNILEIQHKGVLSLFQEMNFEQFLGKYPSVWIVPGDSKMTFTRKINQIFSELKSQGDKYFDVYDCSCICNDCKAKKPFTYTYVFIGNESKSHFSLLMNFNDNNHPIKVKMASRYEGGNANLPVNTITHNSIEKYFTIEQDELDNFVADDNYLDLIIRKNKALDDLAKVYFTIETKEELQNWLDKYENICFPIRNRYRLIEDFSALCRQMKLFGDHLIYIDDAKKAMNEFMFEKEEEYGKLKQWLDKYKTLYEKLEGLIWNLESAENGYIVFIANENYKTAISIFGHIAPFIRVFKEHS